MLSIEWSGKASFRRLHLNRDVFMGGNSVKIIPGRGKNKYKSLEAGTCLWMFMEEQRSDPRAE